jgi:uncharacterized protein involved in exopolysaccharide biosynthesis
VPETNATPDQLDDGARRVTLMDVFQFLRGRAFLFAAGAIIGAAAGGVLAWVSPKWYRAEITMSQVSDDEMRGGLGRLAGQLGGLASLAGIEIGGGGGKEQAVAILKSRHMAEALITQQKMMQLFFANRWDPANKKWNVEDPDDVPTMMDAYLYFDKRVRTVIEDRDRNLVTLRIEWKDPVVAARWANVMVGQVNAQLRERRIAELDASVGYLQKELEKTQLVELRQSIFRLIEARINERVIASTRADYAFRVIDPAQAADRDRQVSPQLGLYMAMGFVFGFALIFTGVLLRAYRLPAKSA